ncbi:hypothetical protein D9756_010828 [Leucocoprinus leucothites]|uniref:CBF1-interacting co-repressor CIR N-terminal domain-containing protein n=1 Tax=Leucocoprinus leucothites TaxID=201217 RepID=A0A8H5CQD5_9AGAR|nr:hypothetical protein D9756_010828 [Leucoagaricus leucothites]
MGKLNIAHHKSYHPYRRDNIERVRKDEEEAKLQEAKEEGRMMLADSEARMDLLRQKAGLEERQKKQFKHADESEPEQQPERISAGGELPTINGHINLFHDVEQDMVAALTVAKKAESKAAERGVKLAPDEKELKRWYTRRHREESQADDGDEDRSRREAQRKYKHDPLTNIEQQLASRSQSSSSTSSKSHSRPRPRSSYPPTSSSSSVDPSVQARLQRESSERERALALIQRKKELEGNMTPSTVYGGDDEGYRDVYNRQEVEDAHRRRDRRRHWDRRRDW